ncbi:MAG: SPOR domain-containing protein [Pseudomonadota bacterium]
MTRAWRLGRTAVAVVAIAALTGCAALLDPQGAQDGVRTVIGGGETDKAMAALTRGDYPNAERYAIAALRRNPKDPHALLVAGIAYQGAGRYDLARQYYEVIISNRLDGTMMVPDARGVVSPRSVVDVARANMAAVDKVTGRSVPRSVSQSGKPAGQPAIGAPPFPTEPATRAASAEAARAALDPLPPTSSGAPAVAVSDAEANVAGRFRILKRLLDEGLITPEEHASRRNANIGALLPYTSPPPAQGLERPIPRDEDVVERLKAIGLALEGRALNPREHAAERGMILDALLPAGGKDLELPVMPPRDMIEAAAAVGRLERMRTAGLVSADEAKRERDAVEKALERKLARAQVDGTVTGLRHGTPEPFVPGAWGVHLASLKSEEGARKSWDSLKRKFPDQLGKLEPSFGKVTLKGKGTRWRVVAGPFDSKDDALKLCKALKLKKQFCDPVKAK